MLGGAPKEFSCVGWSAARHPELVADECATAPVQDRRAPHSARPGLRPPAGRKLLDTAPVPADRRTHLRAPLAPPRNGATAPRLGHRWPPSGRGSAAGGAGASL